MITDNEYLQNDGVSQSRLKKILIHPNYFMNDTYSDFDEPAEVTLIGDGVDLILTQGEDVFNEQIAIATVERPTGMLGDYVWSLYVNRNEENAHLLAYEQSGYKISPDKVQAKFEKEGLNYYNQLISSEDKKLITPKQYETIIAMVESFKTHPFTTKLFTSNEYTRLYQLPLFGKWGKFNIKGLLDMVVYDKVNNIIYPYDIKTTTKSLLSFEDTIFHHRYDFQAAFYLELLHQNLGLIKEELKAKVLPHIANFSFICDSQIHPGSPLIFQMSESAINIGRNGGERKGRTYEGFSQAMQKLDYHTRTDKWNYRMEDYENQGIKIV